MTQPLALQDSQVRTISVLLVCNERVIRAALRALIDGQGGMTVVGEVDRLDDAIDQIVSERPDVTILDPDQYRGNGIADLLRAGMARTRVVLLTSSPNATPISEALENGAVGLVLKQQPPEVLIKAINKVYAGELWLDRTATARLIAELSPAAPAEPADPAAARVTLLTRREREVVTLVGEGLRNSQIADRLRITEVTVRNHLTSTFRKLEVANRFQLVIYAFQHGLASLPSRVSAAAGLPAARVLDYQKKTS
jgi:DNA-binding NarL/FixJ family response regulator